MIELVELKHKFIWFHESWSLFVITQFKGGMLEILKAVNSERAGACLTDWKRQKVKPQSRMVASWINTCHAAGIVLFRWTSDVPEHTQDPFPRGHRDAIEFKSALKAAAIVKRYDVSRETDESMKWNSENAWQGPRQKQTEETKAKLRV